MIILFLVAVIYSCGAQENTTNALSELVIVDEYRLPIPQDITINSWTQKGYVTADSISFLYYHDGSANQILVYDVESRFLVKIIDLAEYGPDGVGRARGLSIESPNRIWMSSIGRAGSYVINDDGKPVEWIPYEWEGEQMADYTSADNNPYRNIIFDGDIIYIPQRIPMYGYRPPTVDHSPIVKFDVKNKKMQLLDFKYPVDYYEKEMPVYFAFEALEDKLLFSLVGSHEVQMIDKATGQVDTKTVRSKYIIEDIKSKAGLGGVEEIMMYNASEPTYPEILPDPYRHLVYRIARLPPRDPEVIKENYNQLHWTPDRFSIIVCDEQLNVLFEQELPSRTYFPYGMFVDPSGIHIPKTHPEFYLASGSEDEMTYDVFVPK